MKLILFFLFVSLMSFTDIEAQSPAFSEVAFVQTSASNLQLIPNHKSSWPREHCRATRMGIRTMIVGGSLMAVGGIVFYIGQETNHSRYISVPEYTGFGLVGLGVPTAIVGALIFIGGETNDLSTQRFSVIGNGNQLGIAYNFQ